MRWILVFICLYSFQATAQPNYRKDFDYLWSTIKEDYAYWDKKATEWNKVKNYYAPLFDTVSSRQNFVLILEKVFNEIYDHHASLNTNTRVSQRLVPSGTDIWAAYINGRPFITEVRLGFGAVQVGLRAGMEIVSFNDVPVELAIQKYLPVSVTSNDKEAKDYALRILLAGLFIDDRKIVVRDQGVIKTFFPDRPTAILKEHQYKSDIESKIFPGNIGYIRINNRLGENGLITLFDSVLQSLHHTNSLILDFRETPSGGNTTVARAIMGSFISKEAFYQKHELTAEERSYGVKRSWLEIVSPRKKIYAKPLVVLVNHWTGSVGEGIAIGFDALKRATIIGTSMAGLNGAIYSYQMPESKIGFSFPVEKLFHVSGLPRELFVPTVKVDLTKQKPGEDLILSRALQHFKQR
ncbi:MAG: S41 family peptidase [Chitinophagaceae bacterium]